MKKYKGLSLILRPGNFVDRVLYQGHPYEEKQIEYLVGRINAEDIHVFVDVGANIGLYSLMVAKSCPKIEKIVAIEAQVENFNQFCGNITLNNFDRVIKPINIGASDKKGSVTFLINKGSSTGTSRVQETAPSSTKAKNFEEVNIDVDMVDNLLRGLRGKKIFIKIDVEGHEINVLKGMRDTLAHNSCIVQVEILEDLKNASSALCKQFDLKEIKRVGADVIFENNCMGPC